MEYGKTDNNSLDDDLQDKPELTEAEEVYLWWVDLITKEVEYGRHPDA